jgi:hypothetical protein
MGTRIDWGVSITPVVEIVASGEALGAETLSSDIKGSLGGGNSKGAWTGSNIVDWSDRVHTHMSTADGGSENGEIAYTDADGVFVKNSGHDYDATVTVGSNINRGLTTAAEEAGDEVTVTIGGVVIASLKGGEAIFLPNPDNSTITLGSTGSTPIAVQYAVLN